MAVTHPNSFLDPVIYADSMKPVMHFLARGDVFKKGIVEWFFVRGLNMIPIYRQNETQNSGTKNQSVFRWVYRLLKERANIVIFSEGHCVPEKRVRPMKKGTATMAFGAMEEYGPELDVQVVPVAINYPDHNQRYQQVTMIHGKSIPVIDYWDLYQEKPARAIKKLSDDIRQALQKIMIVIEQPEAELLANTVLEIARNDHHEGSLRWLRRWKPKSYTAELGTSRKINTLYREDTDGFAKWEKKAKQYNSLLASLGLRDEGLAQGQMLNLWEQLALWLGWPLALIGQLFTLFPRQLGAAIVKKKKLKGTQWFLSFWFGIEWITFMLLYLTAIILIFTFIGNTEGWIAIPVLMLCSMLGERYVSLGIRATRRGKWRWQRRKHKEKAVELIRLRTELQSLTTSA